MQCPSIHDSIDDVEQLVEEVSLPLRAAGNMQELSIPQRRAVTSGSPSGGGFAAHGVLNGGLGIPGNVSGRNSGIVSVRTACGVFQSHGIGGTVSHAGRGGEGGASVTAVPHLANLPTGTSTPSRRRWGICTTAWAL